MLNHHNKKQIAQGHVWTDEQKRTVLKYAKDKTVAEISALTGKDEKAVMNMAGRLGCGYRTV